ncbi:ZP1 protein, partial [Hemiprocne comata]|nr:ZP1 protein [Hemiprocne comata]
MGGSFSFLLLLFLWHQGPGPVSSALRYRYECGELGMQLLAYPPPGRSVRFRVTDEFGTRFDVANCSICLHWLNAGMDGAVIFSSGYEGCHVLVKEDRYVLRVQLEERLPSGVLTASHDVNMTCPQPEDYKLIEPRAGRGNSVHQTQADVRVPLSQPGLLHHVSQSVLTHPGPQLTPQAHLEQVHPVAQTQPILVHPGLQTQSGRLLPGVQIQNQPGLVHRGASTQPGLIPGVQTQNQPGWVNPRAQTQQGLLHPGAQTQNQPALAHRGAQTQPGLHHQGVQTPNQPALVHRGAQTQPGHYLGVQTPNQPGLVHHGAQTQPGLHHLGVQTQNQPGWVHRGAQTQPGLHNLGVQTQNQPGWVHRGAQTQPGLQTQNQPGWAHRGAQIQPGLHHPGVQTANQPSLVHPGVHSGLAHSGAQPHAGLVQSGPQPQNQPGFTHSNLQTHSQTSFLHPVLQSQAGLGHPGHSRGLTRPGLQSRPGLFRPGLEAQLQPGLLGWDGGGGSAPPSRGMLRAASPSVSPPGTPLTREQCQVTVGRMACVSPQGREACLQAGCCYDDRDRVTPCYYGNTATVQCLLEGHFVLVVPRGVTSQPYNLDSVRLASPQPGCQPTRVTETFVMFRFPVTQCGTTVQVIEDRLIYENQLISTIDVQGSPRGSITRDSPPPHLTNPLPLLSPLLNLPTDESYSSYHSEGDYPLVRVLRDPIYVEVRLLQKTDPNLVLVLHHCWAAPSPQAGAEPQWPILLPFPSHYQRFVISTFTFVEPPTLAVLEGEV